MPSLGVQPLCTEQYGSRGARCYLPSPDGRLSYVGDEPGRMGWRSLKEIFMSVFLPQGYPESVSQDYLPYQIWDTVQAFASSITGALATQAVLKGVGVGDQTSTVAAATVTWILKDGTGMLGRILFAWMKGSKLDCDAKQWRLFADGLNDLAIFMEILAPAFPACFTLIICTSGFFKETLVNLAGLLVSLLLIPLVTDRLQLTYTLYGLFTAVHLYANYRAVRAVCMETLNRARLRLALRHFLCQGWVPTPAHANPQEPLLPEFQHHLRITLGAPLHLLVSSVAEFQQACEGNLRNYLIALNRKAGTVAVALRHGASSVDIIQACSHALLLETLLCQALPPGAVEEETLQKLQWQLCGAPDGEVWAVLMETHQLLDRLFPRFLAGLVLTGWVTDRNLLGAEEWRLDWTLKDKKAL
ncbi:RUS family member 1 isoform X2 [Gopherus flavomarginatus]|uniref:RUS family member 1 isoform X2 n=1 Tax=Gopherus flavomarginatus TaxID=286002 RepID=UPI0021CBAAD0|nr:RUS family member 1 isoform X2 [Gopherus flavomarginatus]